MTHICVGNLTIIGSDNGLSPRRRQAIIWINAGILLIGPLGTNFSEILIGIQTFSFKKCIWKCRLRNGVHLSQCVKWLKINVTTNQKRYTTRRSATREAPETESEDFNPNSYLLHFSFHLFRLFALIEFLWLKSEGLHRKKVLVGGNI